MNLSRTLHSGMRRVEPARVWLIIASSSLKCRTAISLLFSFALLCDWHNWDGPRVSRRRRSRRYRFVVFSIEGRYIVMCAGVRFTCGSWAGAAGVLGGHVGHVGVAHAVRRRGPLAGGASVAAPAPPRRHRAPQALHLLARHVSRFSCVSSFSLRTTAGFIF